MVVKGKYNKAKVFTSVIEESAIGQLKSMCDCSAFANSKIRIMPDVHTGAGCTIGTTMTITDKVVPNMVGVDIGCGMEVVKIAEKEIDFAKLDEFIKTNIPSGKSHRNTRHPYTELIDLSQLKCARYVNIGNGYLSLGSLGGGNHFIEVDKDDEGFLYIVIHSGSRHIGLEVATQYQNDAYKYHATNGVETKELVAQLKAEGRENEGDLKKDPYRGTNNGDIGINGCFHKGYYESSTNVKYTIRRLEKIVKPSLIFHFGDTTRYDVNYIQYLQFRHSRRSTVLFYDGHVELCKPGQLADKNVWASGFGNN